MADIAIRPGLIQMAQWRTAIVQPLCSRWEHFFNTSDDYQAPYLISQAVNELCPAQIWQFAELGGALPVARRHSLTRTPDT